MTFLSLSVPPADAVASLTDVALAPLPLDESLRPLKETVAICCRLWGPFRRLHVEGRVGDYSYTISTGVFDAVSLPGGEMRISTALYMVVPEGVATANISMTRSSTGLLARTEVGDFSGCTLDQPAREAFRSGLVQPAGGFLGRRTLSDGEVFQLADQADNPLATRNDLRLRCQVAGLSSYKGRAVIVARCGTSHPLASAGWNGWLRIDGNVVVDIDTGVVVLSVLDGWIIDAHTGRLPAAGIALKAWFSVQEN